MFALLYWGQCLHLMVSHKSCIKVSNHQSNVISDKRNTKNMDAMKKLPIWALPCSIIHIDEYLSLIQN